HYDPRITIAGVILNKVASPRHRRLVEDGMKRIGLAVFGALPREASLILPERHLGLVQAGETADLMARLDALAAAVAEAVDLDAVLAAAGATAIAGPDVAGPP
ncbi:nucleotide-binding protein, partial [Escherichia coli]|uniref:nucleotide-binding protein n=1 Tax=Escherichia coli TaxID=562 RepID=UPI003F770325